MQIFGDNDNDNLKYKHRFDLCNYTALFIFVLILFFPVVLKAEPVACYDSAWVQPTCNPLTTNPEDCNINPPLFANAMCGQYTGYLTIRDISSTSTLSKYIRLQPGSLQIGDLQGTWRASDYSGFIEAKGPVLVGDFSSSPYATSTGDISASHNIVAENAFCLDSDCITSWAAAAGGGSSLWATSTVNVNIINPRDYTTKYVTIGKQSTSTNARLEVSGGLLVDTNNLFVDSVNNKVGIGTTAPNAKLHVATPAGTNAEIDIQTGALGHWAIYQDETTEDLRFWNNNGAGDHNNVIFTDSGEVGIGTSSPASGLKLDVEGKVGATQYCDSDGNNCVAGGSLTSSDLPHGNIFVGNSSNIATATSSIYVADNGNVGIGTTTPRQEFHIVGDMVLSGSSYDIGFPNNEVLQIGSWNSDYTTFSEKMRINNNGNVGVGTSSPTHKLEVAGDIYTSASGDVCIENGNCLSTVGGAGLLGSGADNRPAVWSASDTLTYDDNFIWDRTNHRLGLGTSPSYTLHVADTIAVDNNASTELRFNGASTANIYQSGAGSDMYINTNSGKLYLGTTGSGSADVTVTSGRLGIGTSSPGAKLDVKGNIWMQSNYVLGAGHDYGTLSNAASGYLKLYDSSTGETSLMNTGAYPLSLGTNNQKRLTILSSGNVGIGTTTPNAKLQLYDGDFQMTDNKSIKLENSSASTTLLIGNYADGLSFDYNNGQVANLAVEGAVKANELCIEESCKDTWGAIAGSLWTDAGTYIYANNNPSSDVVVTDSGRLGVGTTTPSEKLTVQGNIYIPQDTSSIIVGDSKMTSIYDSAWGSAYGNVTFQPTSGNKDMVFRFMPNGTADSGVMEFFNDNHDIPGDNFSRVTFKSLSDKFFIRSERDGSHNNTLMPIILEADNSYNLNQLVVATSSNVGIGISTPNHKLEVSGDIRSSNFYTTPWSGTPLGVTYIGTEVMNASTTGLGNTCVGFACATNNTGAVATGVGLWALAENTGVYVAALGSQVANGNTGANLVAIGRQAGFHNTGDDVIALGLEASGDATGNGFNTGDRVIGIGRHSVNNNKANDVIAIGYQAGKNNTVANQFIVKQANINSIPLIQGDFSTGNIGIGTTTPSEKLTVQGNAYITGALYDNSNSAGSNGDFLQSTGSGLTWTSNFSPSSITLPHGDILVGNSSNQATATSSIYVADDGNVGIGTTTPISKLHVIQNEWDSAIYISSSTPLAGSLSLTTFDRYGAVIGVNQRYDGISGIFSLVDSSRPSWDINMHTDGSDYFEIQRIPAGGNLSNKTVPFRITSTGNVGIGTTTPSEKLTVQGNANIAESLGNELVTNGTFDSDISGWTNNGITSVTWQSGTMHISHTGTGWRSVSQTVNLIPGDTYYYSVDVTFNSGKKPLYFQQGSNTTIDTFYASSTKSGYFTASSNSSNTIRFKIANDSTDWNLDNITIKHVDDGSISARQLLVSQNIGIGTTTPNAPLTIYTRGNNGENVTALQVINNWAGPWPNTNAFYAPNTPDEAHGAQVRFGVSDGLNNMAWIGYYRSSVNPKMLFGFYANDDLMALTSEGKFGIGTTTPGAKLDIYGTDNKLRLSYDNSNYSEIQTNNIGYLQIKPTSGRTYLYANGVKNNLYAYDLSSGHTNYSTFTSDSLKLQNTSNQTTVQFNAGSSNYITSGNVGIGTTTPNAKLQVYNGDFQITDNKSIKIENSSASTTLLIGNYADGLSFDYNNGQVANLAVEGAVKANQLCIEESCKDTWGAIAGSLWTDAGTYIYANNNPASDVVVTDSGNVGIGTNSPDYDLDVAGSIGIDQYIYKNNQANTYISLGSNDFDFRINNYTELSVRSMPGDRSVMIGAYGGSTDFSVNSYKLYFEGNTGNLGINETSPEAKFEISVDGGGDDFLMLSSDDNNDGDKFIVKNSGNVGIGTTTPDVRLYVATPAGTNAEIGIQSGTSPKWGIYQDDTTDDLRFWNTDNRMTITNEGNVGIGTVTPNGKLVVESSSGTTHTFIQNPSNNDAYSGGTMFTVQNSGIHTNNKYISLVADYDGDNGGLRNFGAMGFGNSNTFSIWSPSGDNIVLNPNSGNVGIGTTTPSQKLYVQGNAYVDSSSDFCIDGGACLSTVASGSANGSGAANHVAFWQNASTLTYDNGQFYWDATNNRLGIGTNSPDEELHIYGSGTKTLQLESFDGMSTIKLTNANRNWELQSNNSPDLFIIRDRTAGANRLVINSSGNIGIGTTTPSEALTVVGNIKLTGVIQQNTGDLAEKMAVSQEARNRGEVPEAGDVVMLAMDNGVIKANSPRSTLVVGVVSTDPAQVLKNNLEYAVPIALSGVVPVKVTNQNGWIKKGDLLVSSDILGRAMKASAWPQAGTVIGKAMENQTSKNDIIEMMVMLR